MEVQCHADGKSNSNAVNCPTSLSLSLQTHTTSLNYTRTATEIND